MNLPDEMMQLIFSYLSYDEISKARAVCKQFNILGGNILNHGFKQVRSRHARSLKEIKDALPRRESERRKHALYPRHDVLQAVDTRLSLLSMTYSRLIQERRCCFIPGKVLDELSRILQIVRRHGDPLPNTLNLLQEMRDISSMAMEHFDEMIAPGLSKFQRNTLSENACTFCSYSHLYQLSGGNQALKKVSREAPSMPQGKRIKSLQHQERKIISLLTTKVFKQNRAVSQMTLKQQQLENKVSTLTQTVNELKGQFSELVRQVSTHQFLLEARTEDPVALPLHAGASGELNNNICKQVIPPRRSTTEKYAEKRQFSDETETNEKILKKRLKH